MASFTCIGNEIDESDRGNVESEMSILKHSELKSLFKSGHITVQRVFPEYLIPFMLEKNQKIAKQFYEITTQSQRPSELIELLHSSSAIKHFYETPNGEPAAEPAFFQLTPSHTQYAASMTPALDSRQAYLDPAPLGINARHAWSIPGGMGENVNIIVIDGDFRFSHEDLLQNQGGIIGGYPIGDKSHSNHGTAVIGIIGADHSGPGSIGQIGIKGIAPEAKISGYSIYDRDQSARLAATVTAAVAKLNKGDIILIEYAWGSVIQDPDHWNPQYGMVAAEYYPAHHFAIKDATDQGIIVVEVAGNGGIDLLSPELDDSSTLFPNYPYWENPFKRNGQQDSGAILVGAGAPPEGTNGVNNGPDRSCLPFSNYGSCIDCQGWGREVTTCGAGDLAGGSDENRWYTKRFSGTSSAAPIIAGVVASLQGVAKHRNGTPLSPSE
jgi:hypothetical protein